MKIEHAKPGPTNFTTTSLRGGVRLALHEEEDALWVDGTVAEAMLWAHDILESTRKACLKAETECPREILRAIEALEDFTRRGAMH